MGETGQEYRNYVLCHDKTLFGTFGEKSISLTSVVEMDSALKLKFRKPVLSFSLDGRAVHLAPTIEWSFVTVLFQRAEPLYLIERFINRELKRGITAQSGALDGYPDVFLANMLSHNERTVTVQFCT